MDSALTNLSVLSTRQALVDEVYDVLMAQLMDRSVEPGCRISIDGLCRALGVSATPVREALARIEASGIIVREPRRGFRAAPKLSPADVDELMVARLVIEPYNAWSACKRRAPGLVSELGDALEAMQAAPIGPTYREFRCFMDADVRFHEAIGHHCGNRFLADAVRGLGSQVKRFQLFAGQGVTDASVAIAEHKAVLDAIRRGSAEEARDSMRLHLEGVRARAVNAAVDQGG